MVIFNGTTLIATLESGVTSYTGDEIYADWKRHMRDSFSNMGFPPAFDTIVGGDTVDAATGEAVDRQLFFRNDLGWRLRPPEEDIEITITGDLNARDSTLPIIVPTIGGFTALVRLRVSSKARILESGVSGLTVAESAALLLSAELQQADHYFDHASGLLHYYRRGTTVDLIPAKSVMGFTAPGDVTEAE